MSIGGRVLVLSGCVVLAAAMTTGNPVDPGRSAAAATTVPAIETQQDLTAGVAVYDRETDSFTEQRQADMQFRSASVVKLLIVLDFLWDRGPDYDIPAADRARLDPMLSSSEDSAATYYWQAGGQAQIVDRMVQRLGLTGTAGPPSGYPGYWGYTAVTAADTVRIYRYLLDTAPAPVRDYVLGHLREATRCGIDGFDQYFGIASAFEPPWRLKQGWSGFGSSSSCLEGTPATANGLRNLFGSDASDGPTPLQVDLSRHVLHTTGTVGADDRAIVAVYSLHPVGTSYGAAYSRLTELVRSLDVPGATPRQGSWFGTWGSSVRVRAGTNTSSPVLTHLPDGVRALISCQQRGETVTVPPYTNDWWAYLPLYDGYMTNIYVSNPDNQLPGVPEC